MAQQPRAHRRASLIEHVDQRAALARAGAFEQLEIAARLWVEEHEGFDAVVAYAIDLRDRRALGLLKILQHGAGRAQRERLVAQAKSGQRARLELLLERIPRRLSIPAPGRPGRHTALDPAAFGRLA